MAHIGIYNSERYYKTRTVNNAWRSIQDALEKRVGKENATKYKRELDDALLVAREKDCDDHAETRRRDKRAYPLEMLVNKHAQKAVYDWLDKLGIKHD